MIFKIHICDNSNIEIPEEFLNSIPEDSDDDFEIVENLLLVIQVLQL